MGLNLPVIDISPFISWPDEGPQDETGAAAAPPPAATLAAPRDAASMTPAQRTTVAALRAAVRHPGFFYLVGHGVPRALMDEVVRLGRAFYEDNDAGAKGRVARRDVGHHDDDGQDGDGARGWQDVDADQNDWHEALDFYAEIPADAVAAHRRFKAQGENAGAWAGAPGLLEGRNRWPRHPAALRPALEAYVPRLCAVGTAVLRALGHALELTDPDFFVARTRDSFWCLRVLGYPPLPPPAPTADDDDEEEELAGCGEHSDYGCLTLLLTDPSPGALKVKVPPAPPRETDTATAAETEEADAEATWVDADPVPGAYVVNIGDMVEQWTGGWAVSTRHKVLHAGARYRVSVPFFFEPAKDVVVRRLPEFGGTDADPAVRYWDHLVSKIDGSFFRRRTTW